MLGLSLSIGAGQTAGFSTNSTISARDLNKLMLVGTMNGIKTAVLDVCLRTARGGDQWLINAIPVYALAEISDLFGGFSLAQAIQMADLDSNLAGEAASVKARKLLPVSVDLNQLMLSGSEQLIVTLTCGAGWTTSDTLSCYWVNEGLGAAENPLVYRRFPGTPDFDCHDPVAIFGYRLKDNTVADAAGSREQPVEDMTTDQIQFELRLRSGGNYKLSALEASAYTAMSFESEVGTRRTVALYADRNDARPLEYVHVTASGADLSNWMFIGLQRLNDAVRVSAKGVEIHNRVAQMFQEIDARPNGQVLNRMLRHVGRVGLKPEQIAQKAASVAKSTTIDWKAPGTVKAASNWDFQPATASDFEAAMARSGFKRA